MYDVHKVVRFGAIDLLIHDDSEIGGTEVVALGTMLDAIASATDRQEP